MSSPHPAVVLARLEKRRAKTQADRDKLAARLGNSAFVANAPPEVVAKERERVADLDRQTAQLSEQLRRLELAGATAGGGAA